MISIMSWFKNLFKPKPITKLNPVDVKDGHQVKIEDGKYLVNVYSLTVEVIPSEGEPFIWIFTGECKPYRFPLGDYPLSITYADENFCYFRELCTIQGFVRNDKKFIPLCKIKEMVVVSNEDHWVEAPYK